MFFAIKDAARSFTVVVLSNVVRSLQRIGQMILAVPIKDNIVGRQVKSTELQFVYENECRTWLGSF